MTAITQEEENWAKNVGTQMNGVILCPRQCTQGQTLSTYGDDEANLFCPHCDLQVEVIVQDL